MDARVRGVHTCLDELRLSTYSSEVLGAVRPAELGRSEVDGGITDMADRGGLV